MPNSRIDKPILIEDLMKEYYLYIFHLAFSILDDPDEAEDAAQETFIRAATHLCDYRGEAEIRTWLTAITVNVCRSELRKRKRRGLVEQSIKAIHSLVSGPPDPEDQTAQNDLYRQLRQAIAGLDEKHRLPIILYYIQHLSVSQIAAIMETNEDTTHSRLFHARRKLAAKLGRMHPDESSLHREGER
jgi:RNA polymerase sigma-70 factor (ECF subfamily)